MQSNKQLSRWSDDEIFDKKTEKNLKENKFDYIVTEDEILASVLRHQGMTCPPIKNIYGCFKEQAKTVFLVAISEDVTKLVKSYLEIYEPGKLEILHGDLLNTSEGYVIDSRCPNLNNTYINSAKLSVDGKTIQ